MEIKVSFQQIIIAGNLGKDPDLRFTQNGTAVCSFSVAVSEREKKNNEWVDKVEWFRVICFEKTAENAGQYLTKGSKVLVVGRIKQETYKDKDGIEKRSTTLMANTIKFLSSKGEGAARDPHHDQRQPGDKPSKPVARSGSASAPHDEGEGPSASDGFIDDSDLPF